MSGLLLSFLIVITILLIAAIFGFINERHDFSYCCIIIAIFIALFGLVFICSADSHHKVFNYLSPTSITKGEFFTLVECNDIAITTDKVKIYKAEPENILIEVTTSYNHYNSPINTYNLIVLRQEIPNQPGE